MTRAGGVTDFGYSSGQLNANMARVMAEQNIDLPAIEASRNVPALKAAMDNPAVRETLGPKIADAIKAMPDDKFIATDSNTGQPFLALPWNCAEIQGLNASLARGAQPEDVVSATALGRTNASKIDDTGTSMAPCPRCQFLLPHLHVENASAPTPGRFTATWTDDTTVSTPPTTTTGDATPTGSTPAVTPGPPPASKGIAVALGGIAGEDGGKNNGGR
jgi:hypothetical protein